MASLPAAAVMHMPSQQPDVWLSRAEFMRLAHWTNTWLARQARIGNIRSRTTERKMRNGQFEVEFALASLPPKARARYDAERSQLQLVPAAPAALPLFAPEPLLATTRRLVHGKKEEAVVASALNLLQPIFEFERSPARYAALKTRNGQPVRSKSDMVRYVSEASGVSERTLWRKTQRFEQGGEGALLKQPRKDRDQSRFFRENPDAARLVASLYLGDGFMPGQSVQACCRALEEQCHLVGLVKADLPDYSTVRRFLQSAPAPLKVLAREGKKKFGEQCLPYVTRAYSEPSNQIWVSDHMIADVEVLNDCFADLPIGTPMRMRLTAILDYRSRYVVSHKWCVEGSSVSLGAAMMDAVRQHGPCELFYCDNGKDYQKFAKGAIPGYLKLNDREQWWQQELDRNKGMLARLGIRVNHCIPHHPQSKHVERFFRTVHSQFCASWWTYTAGQPSLRPDSTAALMSIHRRALRRNELGDSFHPSANDLMNLFEVWLDGYHAAPHGGEGMNGRSPAEVFAAERNPAQLPAPPEEHLLLASLEHDTRKVRETSIHLFDMRYLPDNDVASATLFGLNDKEVRIAYDRLDPQYIKVLDAQGYVLCSLRLEQQLRMAPDDPATQAQIAASMQQRGMLARATREQLQAITRDRKRLGAKTPVELLASRALPGDVAAASERVTQRAIKPQSLRTLAAVQQQPKHAAGIAKSFLQLLEDK